MFGQKDRAKSEKDEAHSAEGKYEDSSREREADEEAKETDLRFIEARKGLG